MKIYAQKSTFYFPTFIPHHLPSLQSTNITPSTSFFQLPRRPHFIQCHHSTSLVRRVLLGQTKSNNTVNTVYKAQRIAITRSIVIFADYLSDLVVLNIFNDILIDPAPQFAILAAFLGASTGFLAADLLSGISAWIQYAYFNPGDFFILPTSSSIYISNDTNQRNHLTSHNVTTLSTNHVHTRKNLSTSTCYDHNLTSSKKPIRKRPRSTSHFITNNHSIPTTHTSLPTTIAVITPTEQSSSSFQQNEHSLQTTQQQKQIQQNYHEENIFHNPVNEQIHNEDIFDRLVNSCAVCTPALTIVASWVQSVNGCPYIFVESLLVTMLSLAAITPLLRNSHEPACVVVKTLRHFGLLKRIDDPGWCQINGIGDQLLKEGRFLKIVESALKLVNIMPINSSSSSSSTPSRTR